MSDEIGRQGLVLNSDHFPSHYNDAFNNSPDTLWLRVTPKSFRPNISTQIGINQSGAPSSTSLYFLLGTSITTGLNHTWNELTTVSGAMREVGSEFQKQSSDLIATTEGLSGTNFAARYNQYAGGRGAKNDAPFIYENTTRRLFTVELNFVAKWSAEKEVWNPIQSMMVWSCASEKGGGQLSTSFKFPYVFRVQTVTGDKKEVDLINFSDAAIESILPTYNQPYKNGYPMSAQCSVSFVDINPVYREIVSTDGKPRITVRTSGTTDGQGNIRGL